MKFAIFNFRFAMVGWLLLAGCATRPAAILVPLAPPLPPPPARPTLLIGRSQPLPLVTVTPSTNLVQPKCGIFTDLTGGTNDLRILKYAAGPLLNPYPKLPSVIKSAYPVPAPPPLPYAESAVKIPTVDAPYSTNWWKVKAWQQDVLVVDYINFTSNKTYALQTGVVAGQWKDSFTTTWTDSRNDYWRVTLPTSGLQSGAQKFIRFKQAP